MKKICKEVRITSPNHNIIRRKSDIKCLLATKQSSYEFINYKPLSSSDIPVEPFDEDPFASKHKHEKMRIEYDYIRDMYDVTQSLNLTSASADEKKEFPCELKKSLQLFIDLDDTLIHAYNSLAKKSEKDMQVSDRTFISLRPYLMEFLSATSKYYDIYIFSSGVYSYVQNVLDIIDPACELIQYAFCKEDCINISGLMLKMINAYDKISAKTYLLVDDNIANIIANASNSILIAPFHGDTRDNELQKLCTFLVGHSSSTDLRKDVKNVFNIEDIKQYFIEEQLYS